MDIFDIELLSNIGNRLIKRGETIAAAESVTSGLMQHALSSSVDASRFYQGGITVYNIGQKHKHLNVEPIHAQEVNCVSQKVSTQMALEVCKMFNSNWGIGITGYASPVPESENKVFAWYTIVFNNSISKSELVNTITGNPFDVQCGYVKEVINQLKNLLRI